MNTEKIGFIEAIALIAIVMTNKIILNTPKVIISNTRFSSLDKHFIYINNCNFICMVNWTFIQKISNNK